MENPVNDFVCASIRKHRMANGLRVADMAERTGIPLGSYSCLETGRYRMSLENLFRIIHVLGVEIAEVWPRDESGPRPVKKIDKAFVRKAIAKARKHQPKQISLYDILEVVCDEFAVTRKQLSSPSRRRDLAEARTVAAVLTREQRHLTLVSLSRALCRDVSTLGHCMRRLEDRLTYDRHLAGRIRSARRRLKVLHIKGAHRPRPEDDRNAQ